MSLARRLAVPSLPIAARAGLIAQVGIVVTGGAVRLTGSGLGCPSWPGCSNDTFIPNRVETEHPLLNQTIEFGNRLLTFAVLATAVIVVVAARRSGRPDLRALAWAQPLGVLGQVLLGGLTVLVDLHPAAVAAHFLLSMAIIAAAVVLLERASPPLTGDATTPVELTWLARGLLAAVALLLAVGTVVTGAGPHAGDADSPRFHIAIDHITQLHADVAYVVAGLALALAIGTRLADVSGVLRRRSAELFIVVVAQGVLGYVQYALGVPALLVGLHVLGAALVWVAALRVALAHLPSRSKTQSGSPGEPT